MRQQNKNNRGSGTTKQWQGYQQLNNYPSLVAQKFRVAEEKGRSCSGSLTVFDGAFKKNQQFSWKANYLGEGHWAITGKKAGAVDGDGFSPNKGVNYEATVFVRDRLNAMRKDGSILQPQFKPARDERLKPPAPTAPTPVAAASTEDPPPPPKPASPAAPTTALPGAVDVAPPMIAVRIPVNRIRPNPEQPRKYFRKYALRELAASMKEDSQRQLIEVVRVYDDPKADYELITGERRLRAAIIGGITQLNAIVKDAKEVPDKKKQHHLCFVADFHREGYSKLEIALALVKERENGATVEQLCKICGRSVVWVYQHLALDDLVPELKNLLDPSLPRSEQLSFTIGCRLARLPKERQTEVYRQVAAVTGSRLQLIEVKKLVAEIAPARAAGRPRKPAEHARNLRWIVPRSAADALTADGLPDSAIKSLIDNTGPEVVETMLNQIDQTIQGFESLRRKIREAQKPALKRQVQ